MVHDARLADARGAEDGAADRFPGLFAGLVAAFQQRHGFAESRMQDEQLVGVGDAFGRRPLPPFATVCGRLRAGTSGHGDASG